MSLQIKAITMLYKGARIPFFFMSCSELL